jgi:hypothetical protein
MKRRNEAATVKFCGRPHPQTPHVGCVLEMGHAGRHLGYLPAKATDPSPGLDNAAPARVEVWWEP